MDKDEAKRALDIAAKKLSENDYVGTKHFLNKAQNLYPELDGLKQVLMMLNVYISGTIKTSGGNQADWYGVLVKRQYKKLALLLHPDKNMFHGAEGAFKLLLHAWSLLSDRAERLLYDERRMKPPPSEQDTGFSNYGNTSASNKDAPMKLSNQFWTKCNECKTRCEYWMDPCLNKTVLCPMCGKTSIATEQIQRANVRQGRKTYNVLFGFYR
ncbi:hypothetical protein N665_0030s0114 [Sinapis alba]|nr:hypothetical protein N665_0030s0114 [Sinapis alba]